MGHKTTDAEVQKVYDEYWKRIVEPDGVLDFEQVKKELFDYHTVIGEVTKVYGHITSNQFTKPTTAAEAVIDAAEEHYKWWFSEDEPDKDNRHLDITHPDWKLDQKWVNVGYVEELVREVKPGQPCGPFCQFYLTEPCPVCGRYQAGSVDGPLELADGPISYHVVSEPWETREGWENVVAKPVVFSNMAPREAKQILELVGECLSCSGYSVELILKAIKATPHLRSLIRIAERVEVAGDTDVVCPFCDVVGDRNHLRDCLVTEARKVLVQVKAATQ